MNKVWSSAPVAVRERTVIIIHLVWVATNVLESWILVDANVIDMHVDGPEFRQILQVNGA
jgi:hypothetical protein